jgi:shikimate kinase
MRVVFLYGPPAVGKHAVGTRLATLTGFRLFHNHLTVNLATAIFARESEPWVRLLQGLRRYVYAEAARAGTDLVVTGVYRGTTEQARNWHAMLQPVRAAGGQVLFVQLHCSREELFRRVQNPSRQALDKLTAPASLEALLGRWDLFARVPFGPHLRLDTTRQPPSAAAEAIATHFALPRIAAPPAGLAP